MLWRLGGERKKERGAPISLFLSHGRLPKKGKNKCAITLFKELLKKYSRFHISYL